MKLIRVSNFLKTQFDTETQFVSVGNSSNKGDEFFLTFWTSSNEVKEQNNQIFTVV